MKLVKTTADYRRAMQRVEALMLLEPSRDTPEADELEVLAFLIEAYEKSRFPIPAPDPIAAIRFRMEQQGLSRKDLEPYLGGRSKVSEVLSRKRPLSLAMIRKLHEGLKIPVDVLLELRPAGTSRKKQVRAA
ncbi:type II toxin-antitoxin system HigA family antitoxin [Luteolibacter sp. Populi]|uniref:helix-turn-helix domain-containing protein n=1 Tax=Luteolibacter sp. Populi TaxID=3230487 RepID=UPI00346518E5